eukprot:Gregarina_sp_Poly_1__3917@NODE_2173_length_2556_cov_18_595822_g1402_i0_p2_GENE_NODE_2173_length_2556_cov_18_595822_g1402_i0NODE_2173_length_2556_cov_18_595822_g1402_i0_p2_ORF_typecomplete_len232_score22_94Retrotrans_gag/PF03732_17/3_2e10zfCCHC_4/PF14392_6/0_12_NODE_2173_length_2556_cov_18_595822_g1402_i014862181
MPRFKGKGEARGWLDTIQVRFLIEEVPEDMYVRLGCVLMEDLAATWILGKPAICQLSWAEFRRSVLEHFDPLGTEASCLLQLAKLKKGSLPMSEYVEKARRLRLGLATTVTDEELIGFFINGLEAREQELFAVQDYRSFEHLVRKALDLEHLRKISPKEIMIAALAKKKGVGPRCKYSRDQCEKERRCFLCGAQTHLSMNCPERKPSTSNKRSISMLEPMEMDLEGFVQTQ